MGHRCVAMSATFAAAANGDHRKVLQVWIFHTQLNTFDPASASFKMMLMSDFQVSLPSLNLCAGPAALAAILAANSGLPSRELRRSHAAANFRTWQSRLV